MKRTPVSEVLRPSVTHPLPPIREREILRVAATIEGADGEHAAKGAQLEILRWVKKRTGGELPAAAWDGDDFEHFAGGRNCTAVRLSDQSRDIWAIRADDPDKTVAQRIWTSEAIIGRNIGQRGLFSLRLLVSSPEQDLQITPAVPGLVRQLADKCGLICDSEYVTAQPWIIASEDDADRLIETLVDSRRQRPILVVSAAEDAVDPDRPSIDCELLARTTIGIAFVAVLPARFTWFITERFGKRLSVFGGAVRAYMRGFDEDASPYAHELFLAGQLACDESRQRCLHRMRRLAAYESIRSLRLGRDVLSFASVREESLDLARLRLENEGANESVQLAAAQSQLSALKEDFHRGQEEQRWLLDEQHLAEERAILAEGQLRAAGFRVQQLLDQLRLRGDQPDQNIGLPDSWDEFCEWCEQNLVGRVVLSSRARREVKSPLFKEVGVAARCLLWLANQYRDQRLGGGDSDLRAPIEGGLLNERCGSDSFQFDWQGRRREVEWHIKNGGNTRDPIRCLRIYYFWDEESQQTIVVSMPAHLSSSAS